MQRLNVIDGDMPAEAAPDAAILEGYLRAMTLTDGAIARDQLAVEAGNFFDTPLNAYFWAEKATKRKNRMKDYGLTYEQMMGLTVTGSLPWLLQAGPALVRSEVISIDIFYLLSTYIMDAALTQSDVDVIRVSVLNKFGMFENLNNSASEIDDSRVVCQVKK